MLKKDFYLQKNIKFNENWKEEIEINRDLIISLKNLSILGEANFDDISTVLSIKAKIKTDIYAIDSRDGTNFWLNDQIYVWDEEYTFDLKNSDQYNIIIEEDFSIKEYAIDQILLNIPINLTNNYGKISYVGSNYIYLTEDEYEKESENQIDERWKKLKDYKF
ncbi:hypothetical protein SLITO_v1c02440 [Spiroplasma litorale]|uniref:DUF177 domain-containing protein n=1 Tax=Spiroplasma litorale TaxID=216942 RepID=A0A0K1W0Q3_9MOLU|nr:hypothetical protein [Spiroplasma litorale]AKX33900.1 hypothetical protein SLITO_v1c02440 [Spiroplasma litorale]